MPSRSSRIYTGELAKKLPLIDLLELSAIKTVLPELERKYDLLFDLFDIPRPDYLNAERSWRMLATWLSFLHVPGFQFRRRPGAPPQSGKWTRQATARLYADVKLKMMNGRTASDACRFLSRSPDYKGWKPPTLLKRYNLALKHPVLIELLSKISKEKETAFLLHLIQCFTPPRPPQGLHTQKK